MPKGDKSATSGPERIVADLAKRGEVRARDLQQTARRLAERSARSRRELVDLVRKEIRRQIRGLGLATRADLERLQRRVRELERSGSASRKPAKAKSRTAPKRSSKAKPKPKARPEKES